MKKFIINFWICLQSLIIIINDYFIIDKNKIKIYFGGAFSGNYGGPFVKIKRLKMFFSEHFFRYNIAYILSNGIFISPFALKFLKKKIPIIFNQNGVFYPGWYNGNYREKNKKIAHFYHSSDYVFWQSEFCRRSADKFLGKRRGPGEVLYNSVDTNFFIPLKQKVKSKIFTFLITGKIDESLQYRVLGAIYALKIAHNKGFKFKLLLGGKISPKVLKNCFKLLSDFKILDLFYYLGKYDQINAPAIYQKADAYIMLKYKDPCPNTVIEAMACGLPILYSFSGGVPELVGEKCGVGLRVENSWTKKNILPRDIEIAKGMIKIFKSHKTMSFNCRKRAVDMFDIKYWVNKHNDIFKKQLEK